MDSGKVAETLIMESIDFDKAFDEQVEKVRRKFGIGKLTKEQREELTNRVLQGLIDDLYRDESDE